MKVIIKTPKTTNNAIILPSDQRYLDPPHCSASNRHTIAGMRTTMLIGSNCKNSVQVLEDSFRCRGGAFRNKVISMIVMAPIGKMM